MRYVSGYVQVSKQMHDEMRRTDAAWRELEWTATHYDEATDEQRAHLDRALAAIDAMDDDPH